MLVLWICDFFQDNVAIFVSNHLIGKHAQDWCLYVKNVIKVPMTTNLDLGVADAKK